jgi:hypothetical protein
MNAAVDAPGERSAHNAGTNQDDIRLSGVAICNHGPTSFGALAGRRAAGEWEEL